MGVRLVHGGRGGLDFMRRNGPISAQGATYGKIRGLRRWCGTHALLAQERLKPNEDIRR